MEWIVFWMLSVWVSTPCPLDLENEFGQERNWSCAVNHGHYDFEQKSKQFVSKEEAEAFLERCNDQIGDCKLKEIK